MWNIIINLQMHVEWIARMLMNLQRNVSPLFKMFCVSFSFNTIEIDTFVFKNIHWQVFLKWR